MAQIKINDLSVGDWVLNRRGVPTKVQVIVSEGNMRCGEDAKPEHSVHIWVSDVEPIPITPEMLEKNGFVKNDAYLHKIDIDDNITIGVRRQSDGYMFELKREKRRIGELLAIIRGLRNVHQLQHALRLVGVEKEIEV